MKKVTPFPNMESIRQQIYEDTEKSTSSNIENIFSTFSENEKRYFSGKFKFLMIILGFITLFITWLVMAYNLNNIKAKFVNGIDQSELYKSGFTHIKELEFISLKSQRDRRDLFNNRIPRIPSDAKIDRASKILNLKVNGKYPLIMRVGRATWVRSNGKTTTRYYKNTGYILMNAPKVMPTFNFSLNHKNKFGGKDHDLESREFNKSFEFMSNDKISARLIYTPLSMEEMVRYKSKNNLSYWKLYKNGESFKIIFQPKSWQDLSVNIKTSDIVNVDFIKSAINRDITNDIVNIYTIIFMVLIPPML